MASETQPSDAGAPALVVKNVSHAFGENLALDDVSLEIPRGRFVMLLGLNGAGKSTLFALITRLYDNVTGEIRIFGHDVRRRASAALQRLGVVFQSRTLDLDLTLRQNLLYHCALHGIRGREARQRTERALQIVGLADRAREKVRNLSGGQARRVEIARSLLHQPSLLLLDEPTVGLDIGSRESVINIVRSLVEKEGLGVLWATHLFDEVRPTDLVVILHKGRVLFNGSVPELLAKTATQNVSDAFRKIDRHRGHGARRMTALPPPRRMPDTTSHNISDRAWGSEPPRLGPARLPDMPQGHRLARGAALSAPARALHVGAGAPAHLAVHLRRRLPPDARRVDHPALRNLRALRGLRGAGPARHDPAVQCHAVVAVDGLRPRDRRHAHASRQPVPALVPAGLQANRRRRRGGDPGLRLPRASSISGRRSSPAGAIPLLLATPALLVALIMFNSATEKLSERFMQNALDASPRWSNSPQSPTSSTRGSCRHRR